MQMGNAGQPKSPNYMLSNGPTHISNANWAGSIEDTQASTRHGTGKNVNANTQFTITRYNSTQWEKFGWALINPIATLGRLKTVLVTQG